MVISWPSYCKIQPTFRSTPLSKRLREHEYSIYSLYKEGKAPKNTNKNLEQEREQLYEAYNLLHTLAQVRNYYRYILNSSPLHVHRWLRVSSLLNCVIENNNLLIRSNIFMFLK